MQVSILVHRLLVGDHFWRTEEIKGVSSNRLKLRQEGEKMRNSDSGRFSTYLLRMYDTESGKMDSEVEITPSSVKL